MLIVLCLLRLVDDNLQSTLGVLRASSSLYFIQHQQQQQEITAGHTDCQLINQINHPKQSYLATRAASRLLTGVQYSQTAASMGRFRQTLRRLCSRFCRCTGLFTRGAEGAFEMSLLPLTKAVHWSVSSARWLSLTPSVVVRLRVHGEGQVLQQPFDHLIPGPRRLTYSPT